MILGFDQPFGAVERHLRHPDVMLHRVVERRSDDLGIHRAIHVRDFFRALADQRDHQVHFGIISTDRIGDFLQYGSLAGFGRRHNQPALPLADGRDEIEQSGGEDAGVGFEIKAFEREYGGEVFKVGAVLGFFGVEAVHRVHSKQPVVLLRVFGRAHLPDDHVARAQPEALDLRLADVNIVRARQVFLGAQKADAVVHDLQHAAAQLVALPLGVVAQQPQDDLLLLHAAVAGDSHLARHLAQLFECFSL